MSFKIMLQKKAGISIAESRKQKAWRRKFHAINRGDVSKAKSFDGSPDANVISRAIETMNTML